MLVGCVATLLISEKVFRKEISKVEEPVLVIPDSMDTKMGPKNLFLGIDTAGYKLIKSRVRRGQTLSAIFDQYTYEHQKLFKLAAASKEVWDVRKIRANDTYQILLGKEGDEKIKKFILEPDPTRYVLFDLEDSIGVSIIPKEVTRRRRRISAVVDGSLYNTLLKKETSLELVNRLVDIFAWQVDFFRIFKGDSFKVIFEEKYVGNELIGVGEVYSAYFSHNGQEYYAFRFEQDGDVQYFDEKGNSLRKAFLRAPLKYKRISSRYSRRRFHPVLKRYKAHLGTDYAAPRGTPIYSTGDGKVIEARYKSNNGNYVKIRHNGNYATQYLHMSKIARGIKRGKRVKQGQVIGYVGSTGLATGPHLCYRFWKNGRQVDALRVNLPSSAPLKSELVAKYTREMKTALAELEGGEDNLVVRTESVMPITDGDI